MGTTQFTLTEPPFRNPDPPFLSPTLCSVPEWAEHAAACGEMSVDSDPLGTQAGARAWGWSVAFLGAAVPKGCIIRSTG